MDGGGDPGSHADYGGGDFDHMCDLEAGGVQIYEL